MKKILVVDDIQVNIDAVQSILKYYLPEYEVISAQSGTEALKLADTKQPEVVLLDYLMPNMNGFEVSQQLKKMESTKNIPVLMISALGDNSNIRTQGLNSGADAFISKPFDVREFVALVNVMLRIRNAEDMLRERNKDLEGFIKKQSQYYQDSEERFFQISKHFLEFFWEVDSELVFTFISKSAESILGQSVSAIQGHAHLYDFVQHYDKVARKNEIRDHLEKQDVFVDTEFSFCRKDRKVVWLSMNGFPMFDDQGNFRGYRGVCYDTTQRKIAEDKLKKSVEEIKEYQKRLKKMNRELAMTEEKERKRIAEYLHDGIGQTLSLAFMNLSSVGNKNLEPAIKRMLENTARYINTAIKETRLLTYDLSPPVLYEFGFLPAVKWKLDQISGKFNIKTKFNDHKLNLSLETESSITLYRIMCELISNTIKHAHATELAFEANEYKNGCLIKVSDNGIGFDPNEVVESDESDHFGLFSINERLDALNGRISIDSKKNGGTSFEIYIPEQKKNKLCL